MFDLLKKLFFSQYPPAAPGTDSKNRAQSGMVTRTCKKCGKTITLPEEVQEWPGYCQECRARYRPSETVIRKCRGCGKNFTFLSSARHWPKYCPDCRQKSRI